MDTILCGCQKCQVPCAPFRGCFESCLKEDAYDEKLKKRGYARFEPPADDAGFIPASQAQIDAWTRWLSTPDAAAAVEFVHCMEQAPTYSNYKFDVVAMEKHADNLWPGHKEDFLLSSMWLAYQLYMREQHELKKAYDSVKKNIKAYEAAEEAYKALLQHISVHGQLIREMPKHEHKKLV